MGQVHQLVLLQYIGHGDFMLSKLQDAEGFLCKLYRIDDVIRTIPCKAIRQKSNYTNCRCSA